MNVLPLKTKLLHFIMFQMTGLFQVMVRFSLETESLFTSVERIHEYVLECPNEEEGKQFKSISDQWPESGDLV